MEPKNVGTASGRLVSRTRHELLTFDDPSGCINGGIPERKLVHAAACVRTVVDNQAAVVRQLTTRKGLAQDAAVGAIPWQDGSQARLIDEIPFRVSIMDRTIAAIPVDLDVFYNGMLLVRDPAVVQTLVRAHRCWWSSGEDPTGHPVADELPGYLRPVLDCLLAGTPDEAAAAHLNLSLRTYSRRVGDLLTTLGVTSRFQAGAAAVRRGWA
ncbi:DNA-binding response regulator [Streptomyces triculaminicus]|uniref:DNA-binding response regulator n=1 Tax=Streptomyces triculaminicus TaxID=2816232 RepID=UPI0037D772AE